MSKEQKVILGEGRVTLGFGKDAHVHFKLYKHASDDKEGYRREPYLGFTVYTDSDAEVITNVILGDVSYKELDTMIKVLESLKSKHPGRP